MSFEIFFGAGSFNIIIDPGNVVLCDFCDEDYTESDETGGFLFGRKAVCPHCAGKTMASIRRYKEEEYVAGVCPESMPFADWIRSIR